jgi:hypothetical protein
MTEEEMEMHNLHLQIYLADSLRDDIGDINIVMILSSFDTILMKTSLDYPSQSLRFWFFEIIFPICTNERSVP